MADILISSTAYQGTFQTGTVETDPVYQICCSGTINASNQWVGTIWVHKNGDRVDSNLGDAAYRFRNADGSLVSGMSETGITPDVNGYFEIAPVSAALIYDLTSYLLEVDVSVDDVSLTATIPVVMEG